MKTLKSGSGVTATNLNKVLTTLSKSNKIWPRVYEIKTINSETLLKFWNYKKENLTIKEAKDKLISVIDNRDLIRNKKYKSFYIYNKKNKYLDLLEKKQTKIKNFLEKYNALENISSIYSYTYGTYKDKHRCFKFLENCKYPVYLKIAWDENHDWEYYSKRYKYPKSTYSNRRVEFISLDKKGNENCLYCYELNSFAGCFAEKAIAAFFNIKKINVKNELKKVQLQPYFSLNIIINTAYYQIFERKIGRIIWDYCIYSRCTKETFHSFYKNLLVKGLRKKINAKFEHENEIITKKTGFNLGFCEIGMKNFCSDNNIDFEGGYTRQELRNIIIKNKTLNNKYKNELNKIGIIINN